MRIVDCDLLVCTIKSIVLCKQFKPVCLLASPYRPNERLAGAIPFDFSLGIPGRLVSAMLVLEQFAIHPQRLNHARLKGLSISPHAQGILKVQIAKSLSGGLDNVLPAKAVIVITALFQPCAIRRGRDGGE